MEVEHDLVEVDEFDALAIEVKVSPKDALSASPSRAASSPVTLLQPALGGKEQFLAAEKMRMKHSLAMLKEMVGKYPAKQHARKVAKELGVKTGFIYLPGQVDKVYEDSDMGPSFRQRRYFYYLSGANFAGCHVTYDISRDSLILWIPLTAPRDVLWFGTTPSVEECKSTSDLDDVRHEAGLSKFLHQALSPGSILYVLHPDQNPRVERTRGVVTIDSTKLKPAMDEARVIKTDHEVAMIRRANLVSSAAHRAILPRLRKLSNEREIDAIFRGFCLAHGAKNQAYPVIAGSGPNAGTLHYWQNDQPLTGRQLLLLDAGAEWNCYASDVTRTLPLTGSFSPEASAIYRAVERMQEECILQIRPGITFRSLHLHAALVAATELLKLGVLRDGTAAEMLASGTITAFFPHGLGHHVGLECHDSSGRNGLLRSKEMEKHLVGFARAGDQGKAAKRDWVGPDVLGAMCREAAVIALAGDSGAGAVEVQTLQPNMIVTVEPGIYFCRDYIKAYFLSVKKHAKYINAEVLDKYFPVGGVRIEDCILVTPDGYENLTSAPKGEEMMNIINSGS